MSRSRFFLMAAAFLLPATAAAAAAEPAPALPSEHRLSAEQVEQILAEAARKRETPQTVANLAEPEAESGPSRMPVHGEVGVSVGTGGYRSAYGTAVVGLPGNGAASVSFGTSRLPNYPAPYPGW